MSGVRELTKVAIREDEWSAGAGRDLDHFANQNPMRAEPECLGHAAIEAASAANALEVLRSDLDVDIVITDYAMPEMNGSQLATEIRRIRPHVPVVVATGYAEIPDNALSLPRLDKPYQQQDLAALIQTLLEPLAGH